MLFNNVMKISLARSQHAPKKFGATISRKINVWNGVPVHVATDWEQLCVHV